MSRSDDERVADILEAAGEIGAVIGRGKPAWDTDRICRLAVERLLEIIGESARSMSVEARGRYADVAWSDIVGLRTLLAHRYHRVDPDQVWGSRDQIKVRLPRRASSDGQEAPIHQVTSSHRWPGGGRGIAGAFGMSCGFRPQMVLAIAARSERWSAR